MGQSPSVPTNSPELTRHPSRSFSFTTRFTSSSRKKSTTPMSKTTTSHPPSPPHPPPPPPVTHVPVVKSEDGPNLGPGPGPIFPDPTSEIPDECLAHIFLSLSSGDRKRCSLVCKRWFLVEGQSRCRLSLNANKDISAHLPSLFSRFDSVTKLALRCDRRSISISDDALVLISLRCRNLTRLKLRGCRELTDLGIAAFAQNCKSLKKLSCGSCVFGAKGLNAVLEHCVLLEEISIKRLRGINNDGDSEAAAEPIGPGLAAKSLKSICLKELYNGQLFGPLIVGSKNLKTLKLIRCLGEWDRVLEMMATDKSNYNYTKKMAFVSSFSLLSFLAILSLAQAQSELMLTVVNNCPFTIWPAILPNHGFPVLEKGGFPLSSLTHRSFPVPNTHWAGRIWGRTGCTYANGRFSCATGDCGSRLECNGLGGKIPATLAQFSIHHGNRDHSAYGVSLVDGFNLPMTITPHEGKGVCPVVGCKKNLLEGCPEQLQFRGPHGNGPVVGCKSGCAAFNTDQLCCRNQFNSPKTCHASSYSEYFKHGCPASFTYAHDTSLMHDCVAPRELKVIFCH